MANEIVLLLLQDSPLICLGAVVESVVRFASSKRSSLLEIFTGKARVSVGQFLNEYAIALPSYAHLQIAK